MKKIIFLKLGGSLITDKTKPFTVKKQVIKNLASQIKEALEADKTISLIIGNGGGSFPHYPAVTYRMRTGIKKEEQKMGFCLVQDAAARLNRIIVEALLEKKVRACSVHPSSMLISSKGRIKKLFIDPIIGLLKLDITPVFYGDIVYDQILGAKIFSTEQLLASLAIKLKKKGFIIDKIIHNGLTHGVLDRQGKTIPRINRDNFSQIKKMFYKTAGYDVTGGMVHKVDQSLKLAKERIKTLVINGVSARDLLKKAILGKKVSGTIIG